MREEAQEIADKLGFDLKKLPYGYQFRIGKLILNYYDTTGTVVTIKPKEYQKVKKNVPFSKIEEMLKKLKSHIKSENLINGEQAVNLLISGINVKHKRLGESEWRKDDVKKLPLASFLNKTFVFEIGEN